MGLKSQTGLETYTISNNIKMKLDLSNRYMKFFNKKSKKNTKKSYNKPVTISNIIISFFADQTLLGYDRN